MKGYMYNHEAQIRLLDEIFGNKAVTENLERNRRKRRSSIRNALLLLPEEQRQMILYQYGFTDGNTHTPDETAGYLGISQREAEELKMLALRTLRCPSCSKGLRELLSLL